VGDDRSPPFAQFRDLLIHFHKGNSIVDSNEFPSGVLGREKAGKMLWCLGEAEVQDILEHLWRAVIMMLMRDERHSRMHCRFRSIDIIGDLRSGFLGQARYANADALGITKATPSNKNIIANKKVKRL
jgi:hypothetical protein